MKINNMEAKMMELGKQVLATQTYRALVNDESPLVTKKDHAVLQQSISNITNQMSQLLQALQGNQNSDSMTLMQDPSVTMSPPPNE